MIFGHVFLTHISNNTPHCFSVQTTHHGYKKYSLPGVMVTDDDNE